MSSSKSPSQSIPIWRRLWPVLAAFGLVALAVAVARFTDLDERAVLDFTGGRAAATAEPVEGEAFRVRFTDPEGNIHARRMEAGWLPPRIPAEGGEIVVAYAPDDPSRFLPAGSSYAPGAVVLLLFFAGLTLVLRVRQQLLAEATSRRAPPRESPRQ